MTISPAPWRYEDDDAMVYDAAGRAVVALTSVSAKNEGNGPLLAAAPYLRAALRELIARIDETTRVFGGSPFKIEPELTTAREALGRADGEMQ